MDRTDPIRVYVAGSNRIARYGAIRALEAGGRFEVVGETSDGLQALDDLVRLAPDVAILADELGAISAFELLAELPRNCPTRAVLLSARHDQNGLYTALRAGATSYLAATTDCQQLCNTVAAAASDTPSLDPQRSAC